MAMSHIIYDIPELYMSLYYNGGSGNDYKRQALELSRVFRMCDVEDVLDVGCGPGLHAGELVRMGYRVDMLDRSGKMLEVARKNNPDGRTILCDIVDYRPQRTYSAVISLFLVMSYMTDTRHIIRAFRNIHDSIRPGGVFVFDVVNALPLLRDFQKVIYMRIPGGVNLWERRVDVKRSLLHARGVFVVNGREYTDDHTFRFYTPSEIVLFMEMAGFRVLRIGDDVGFRTSECNGPRLFILARKD